MKKYFSIAAVTFFCTLTLTACSTGHHLLRKTGSQSGDSSETVPSSSVSSSTVSSTNVTAVQPSYDLNPLTGQKDITPGEPVRPVCVMIGNNDRSRPQYGLDKADLYVETETEGGITRIMAVFSGTSRIPVTLGPVRSARSPFVLIAQSLGAIYCHAGGSTMGTDTIKKTGVSDINALDSLGEPAYWRDAGLKKSRGMEYSLMTSGQKLADRVKARKLSTELKSASPFTFGSEPTGTGAGSQVQVTLSGIQTVSFIYHEDEKVYEKLNGTLKNGVPHKMADGGQITASNVLILYDTKFDEDENTINFRLSSGVGLLASGGKSCSVKWSRTACNLKFTDENGSELRFMPGKTYICLVSSPNKVKTIVS